MAESTNDRQSIRVDEEGEWFVGENRIFRPEILEVFYERLDWSPERGFVLTDQNGSWPIRAADTPFLISRVDRITGPSGEEQIVLGLRHVKRQEILDPGTLTVGKENVLYCRIMNGRFPARFSRPAYYQITQFVEEDPPGVFYIEINGTRYPLGVFSLGIAGSL